MNAPLERILLFSDQDGIGTLLAHVPPGRIAGVVGASIRPRSHPALREAARQTGVAYLEQPLHTKETAYRDFLKQVRALASDALICLSYSMLIRPDVLTLHEGRAFNVHAALLPRNRGPNPLQWAIMHGDEETGVSLHVMDGRFDGGAIIDQERFAIGEKDTWVTLAGHVPRATDALLRRAFPRLLTGEWIAIAQDESQARVNPRIGPESFPIDFARMDDRQIHDLIRAQVAPLKGAYIDGPQGRLHIPTYVPLTAIPALRERHA